MTVAVSIDSLQKAELVGTGGQARVYRLAGPEQAARLLLKEYLPGIDVNGPVLESLVARREALGPAQREALELVSCWPRRLVTSGSMVVGVLIPAAPSLFRQEVRGIPGLRELQFLTHGDRAQELGIALPTPQQRLQIGAALAQALALFEQLEVVHGDLSFKNVLWALAPAPEVFLLDCDAALLEGQPSALPQATTQLWTDPRVASGQIQHPDIDSDRLCLALAIYRTYFQARGDFTGGLASLGDLPTSPPVNHELSNLFSRAFVDSAPRPAAAEWSAALWRLTDELPALMTMQQSRARSIDTIAVDLLGGPTPVSGPDAYRPLTAPVEPPLLAPAHQAAPPPSETAWATPYEYPAVSPQIPQADEVSGSGSVLFALSMLLMFVAAAAGGYLAAGLLL